MSLFIGLSALRSSQIGLDVISQNIANANTPGYHRQNVHLESRNDNIFRSQRIGSGVSVLDLERVRFDVIESFLTETTSDFQRADQFTTIQRQLETYFLPGEGSLQAALEGLFNEISSLAGSPSDFTTRELAVQSGQQTATQFRELATNLRNIQEAIQGQLNSEISLLNAEIERLSDLNQEIITATNVAGELPNGLLDSRDELVNSIAEKIDVSRIELDDGSVSLTFGNYSVQRIITDDAFSLVDSGSNRLALTLDDGDSQLDLSSGRVAALLDAYNTLIPEYTQKLDDLAVGLISNFDRVHSTGIGVNGSFTELVGNRAISSPTATLLNLDSNFPINAGDLYVSIIAPDGTRRTETIAIDPSTQSLNDVVTQINSVGNLSASVNTQTNQLRITASPGYQFDFTGTTETIPSLAAFTGTSTPNLGGTFDGNFNETYSFEISGSGDVGVSPNLSVLVRDSSGNLVSTQNIGSGYEAGSPIDLGNGVTIEFPPGTVLDGDSFDAQFVAIPDETGLLVALGVNSFFTGTDAASINVDESILADSGRFATSFTGDAAESAKINEFIELADAQLLAGNRLTFNEYLVEVTVGIGIEVQTSQQLTNNLDSLLNQYRQERDSISGVDINEEFVRLNQFQRSYEAAVRVMQTAESVMDELFALIR